MAKIKISPAKHKRQIEKYRAVEGIYKKYAKVMDQILTKAAAVYAPHAIIQSRPKSLSSFAEKSIRKADKYANPVEDLTDLCGARVITHAQAQVDSISQFIKEHFEVHEMDSIDVGTRHKIMEFGYIALHYIVSISKDSIMGIPIPEEIKGKKAEIQLRTLLQHTWADIVHDRIYKSPIRVPDAVVRESARLAASMENSDRGFANMAAVIDAYAAGFGASLRPDELEREVNMLGAILKNEPRELKKPHIALRLAQIFRSSGEWKKIIKLLEPLKTADEELKPKINLELGYAYCRRYKHKPLDKRFLLGQKLLRDIARPEDEIIAQTKISPESSYDMQARRIRSRAMFYLACSACQAGEQDEIVRQLHHSAYLLDTSNPYIFAAFLECEINYHRGTDFLKLLTPSIISAIETCQDHIKVDIEIPLPYLTIGRLWLMLDNFYESLYAYTKAIDLYTSHETSASTELIEDEFASLKRLSVGGALAERAQWVRELFCLAQTVIGGQSREEMTPGSNFKYRHNSSVRIIAGGATGLAPATLTKYKRLLLSALSGYSGSMISGGTTSGICGVIGSVVGRLRKEKSVKCDLVGYLPRFIPANVTRDDRNYRLVTTDGTDFSPLEPLLYWTDIIASGISPAQVRVVGINGGDLSGFEFRLALALGGTVGIVESSGRAASSLLQDQDWMDHSRLLILSQDPKTLWAFMTQEISSRLKDEQIDKAARQVHMEYCQMAGPGAVDSSLLSWDLLPEDLKESNRQQVLYMEEILRHAEYCIRLAGNTRKKQPTFSPKEIELMAEMEHGRWNVERLRCGWRYGSQKNVEKKISPHLKSWKDLPNHIKDYDRQAVRKFPHVLGEAGFEVYRCKKASPRRRG